MENKSNLTAAILHFVQLTLDDDQGISSAAMAALEDLRHQADGDLAHHLDVLLGTVDACEGRYYIPAE